MPTRRVLILCTGNSCRSQMAEAFWRKHGGDDWEVISAGTRPSGRVSRLAVAAMDEVGIDIRSHRSQSLEPYLGQAFDLVITVCSNAEASCPRFPGDVRHVHHPFDDPADGPPEESERMKLCRRVRDEIEAKVKAWIAAEGP